MIIDIRMIIDALESLGLTESESKLYAAMLELGPASATVLSQHSRMHRTNIYDSIARLEEKGLASAVARGKRRLFEAADPKKLDALLDEKRDQLEKSMPALIERYRRRKEKSNVWIFEGRTGIKEIFDDFLDENKTVLMYGVPGAVVDIMRHFLPNYHQRRIAQRIHTKAIFNADAKSRMKYINDLKYAKARYLPTKLNAPASTNIYGDKIAIILWSKEPLIIQIGSKEIADAYRAYFRIMWGIAKEVKP